MISEMLYPNPLRLRRVVVAIDFPLEDIALKRWIKSQCLTFVINRLLRRGSRAPDMYHHQCCSAISKEPERVRIFAVDVVVDHSMLIIVYYWGLQLRWIVIQTCPLHTTKTTNTM